MFGFDFSLASGIARLGEFYYWMRTAASGRLLGAGLILAAGLMASMFLRFVLCRMLGALLLKKITYDQERAFRAISMPLAFIPVTAGVYVAIASLLIPGNVVFYTRALIKSFFAFNATWLVYACTEPVVAAFKRRDTDNTKTVAITWAARVSRFLIVFIGMSVILEHWGVKVTAIIASLGVVAIGIGLGAQDMFRNIISGIAIISENRFNVGDIVKTEGANPIEGIVENIGFRSTLIRKFDKAPMYVPNNTLADAAVVNFSSRLYRRVEWTVRLEYRTSASQLRYIRQIIEDYMTRSPEFVKPPEALLQVRIDKFGDSSIDMLVYCFTNTNVWIDFLRIKEELLLKIKETVEAAGARFAMPTASVYIEKVDEKMRQPELPRGLKSKVGRLRTDKEKAAVLFVDEEA
ncbi:MAG: mechanosensitive ion channel family protein [Rickettsiales bacterium]|jgi:MscS family membrane protein|nr:mechanosensitive ion channel family protein [Rickettsiales bacterium]